MFLYVRIFKCEDLDNYDLWSENDVYCKIDFQGTTKYTEVINDNNDPEWDAKASFIFPYAPLQCPSLTVHILDSDTFSSSILKSVIFDVNDADDHTLTDEKNGLRIKYGKVFLSTIKDIEEIKRNTIHDIAGKIYTMTV